MAKRRKWKAPDPHAGNGDAGSRTRDRAAEQIAKEHATYLAILAKEATPGEGQTGFARWQQVMDYSNAQAARALGASLTWVKALKRGREYGTGKPARPDRTMRLAMHALWRRLEPWPD